MFTKTVTKLWMGEKLSVRDYEVRKAIKQGGMTLIHNDRKMILSVEDLKKLKPTGRIIKSKFPKSPDYQLVDITFQDTSDANQMNLI
tara:strand:- start:393 stop:653 length:261 start_codon:yes stop_codon:yes gene_type:complete